MDPLFVPALQSGALHPLALRHQQDLAKMVVESPTSVQESHAPGSRPLSAPPELSKYPDARRQSAEGGKGKNGKLKSRPAPVGVS